MPLFVFQVGVPVSVDGLVARIVEIRSERRGRDALFARRISPLQGKPVLGDGSEEIVRVFVISVPRDAVVCFRGVELPVEK